MSCSHIEVVLDDFGHVVVQVGGFELYDFIEDYLVEECDLNPEWVRHPNGLVPGSVYEIGFPEECSARLNEALAKLDSQEVEKISRLNRPS